MFGRGFRLGSIFGFEIRLDISLAVLLLLIAVQFAAGVVPALHPDWSAPVAWIVAIAAALLVALSIMVHELAHALVGRRFGIPVSSITLFLFGGVANLEREPPSPRAEFLMAGVGPLVSIVLGAGLLLLGTSFFDTELAMSAGPEAALAKLGAVPTLALWLGMLNLVLGLFNLVPAFPLDGGRVLRAALWRGMNDYERATRVSAGLGRVVGWTFVALGLLMIAGFTIPVFGTGLVGGVWLALIGWFLARAATMAVRELAITRALKDVTVGRIMHRHVPSIAPDDTVADAVDAFMREETNRLVVVADDDALVGVLDVAAIRRVPPKARAFKAVGDVMTSPDALEVLETESEAEQALRKLVKSGQDALLVVDSTHHPAGILRLRDITRWIALHAELGRAA